MKVTQDTEDNNYSLVVGKQVYGTKNYALSARCKATGRYTALTSPTCRSVSQYL